MPTVRTDGASGGRALRILALNWRDRTDPWHGGAEVQLHEILRRLVLRGHEVTWIACRYEGCAVEEVAEDGIRHVRGGDWHLANFALPRLMRHELRQRPYDVVLEDINKIPFYAPLHTRLPVLVMIPHLFGRTIYRETNPLAASYVLAWEWPIPWIYRNCLFSVASASTASDLRRRGIAAARIEVVHNGMEHECYQLDTPPPRGEHPTLIHLGRLRRYKSVDVAVRAFPKIRSVHPGARLVIIGDGPEEQNLRQLAARLGVADSVEFRGYLPREEIVEQLYRSHVLLNPSPKEGWGLTVIEANECGTPVVASRRPGLVDSVRDGETGLLATYGDADDFAQKTLTLLGDLPFWRLCSENAVRWARSFSWDEAAEKTEALLVKSVDGRS
jgi:glycosyltransferase involved in cell wall biosynthesis